MTRKTDVAPKVMSEEEHEEVSTEATSEKQKRYMTQRPRDF